MLWYNTGMEGELQSKIIKMQGTRVLVVDDERFILECVSELLAHHRIHAITASNGNDAVRCLHDERQSLDLVLIDYMMPECNGFEAVATILELYPAMKIIIMSGYAEADRFLHAYGDRVKYIAKPFNHEQLFLAMSQVMTNPTSHL